MWPENWLTWSLFAAVSTQWNVTGMGDYIGLNYMPLFALLDREGLTPDEWQHTFAGVQVLERAALAQIRLNRAAT